MRDLKFRVWGEKSKYMTDDSVVAKWRLEELRDGKYILMQYTGIKDKNGKEIYEGDIVRWNVVVVFEHETKAEVVFSKGSFMADQYLLNNLLNHDVEIVGNIYENPELLKK